MELKGNIVDVIGKRIFKGILRIEGKKIEEIVEDNTIEETQFILPGLIDAHIHIESSMLIPSEFARLASIHGTVATVSDPHEIANVMGEEGVQFMIENGKKVPFKFYFGAPSCVPATPFETSGAALDSEAVERLLQREDIKYLSEMMNFPGVLNQDEEVWNKINAAKKYGKPIDGHAPGLKGEAAAAYINAGINTDHECFTMEEALDKIAGGMKVQIREGSAAKNYESLKNLLKTHPENIMLCSDDRHPNDLEKGHINDLVKRALADGFELMDILQAVLVNPVKHYDLNVGLLQQGDAADLIIIDEPGNFKVLKTMIDGEWVAENGESLIHGVEEKPINKFYQNQISLEDLKVVATGKPIKVIEALEGELITKSLLIQAKIKEGLVCSDIDNDVLKMLVLNRYEPSKPAIGFIKGIGFKKGAIASSVAHDSHNIVAVGSNDADLLRAVELVNQSQGGVSWVDGEKEEVLELPVAGIMSHKNAFDVAKKYDEMDKLAKSLGSPLHAPYMTLSFMALLVIPELKLSDRGLFDGNTFSFVDLVEA